MATIFLSKIHNQQFTTNYYVEIFLLYLEDGMLIVSNIHSTFIIQDWMILFLRCKIAVAFGYFDHCNNSFSCFLFCWRSFLSLLWKWYKAYDSIKFVSFFFSLFCSFFVSSQTLSLCSIDTCSRGFFFSFCVHLATPSFPSQVPLIVTSLNVCICVFFWVSVASLNFYS